MRSAYLLMAVSLMVAGQAFGQLPGGGARGTGVSKPAELPPPYVTRQSDVEIPFSVKPGESPERQPVAVRVFVSWDRGQSWHFYEEKKPADGRFRFKPKQDGEYWFATQTVDRSGKSDNPEPRQPQLRLVIDTQKPQLLAQASVARAGEASLAWSAADATLAPASLKIEYQDATAGGGVWHEVRIDPAAVTGSATQQSGRVVFEPEISGRSINLRAEVADAAGNVAYFSQRVSLATPRSSQSTGGGAPPPDRTATRWSPQQQPSENPFAQMPEQPPEIASEEVSIPRVTSNPFARRDTLAAARPAPPGSEELPAPNPSADILPVPGTPAESAERQPSQVISDDGQGSQEAEHSDLPAPTQGQPEAIPSYAPAPQVTEVPIETTPPVESILTPQGSQPRLTSSRRFSLDYDVEAVGPEGVAEVELWGTSDAGRTWVKWGLDPDKQSPFDVEVNGEMLYGFKVVIVGKSGLASHAPQSGDAADIWVGIDLTRPTARLVSAAYGQGDAAGKLDIRWEAADANLTSRPVTLAICDRPDGAFTPIAAGLPNSGQYYWEFDPRTPRNIYLRLEVRDEAGNVAIDQLTEPIRIEGLQPKGRIRGFVPTGVTRTPLYR